MSAVRRTSAESTSGDDTGYSPVGRVSRHEWLRLGVDLAEIPSGRERFLCAVCGEVLGNDRERSLGNALRWRSWLLFSRRSLVNASASESCGMYCGHCQQSVCALCIETRKKMPDCKTLVCPRAIFQHDWILDRVVLPRTLCCECRVELAVLSDALRCVWCMRGVCLDCQDGASASSCDLGKLRGALLLPWQVEMLTAGNFRVHRISRASISGKGKLAAVVDSMNLVIVLADLQADPWLHFARLLLHPLQVVCANVADVAKLLTPFSDVLSGGQATVAVAGSRALLTAAVLAVRAAEGGAVVELPPRRPADFEELDGVFQAREDLMNVARTKFTGANLGVMRNLDIFRLSISDHLALSFTGSFRLEFPSAETITVLVNQPDTPSMHLLVRDERSDAESLVESVSVRSFERQLDSFPVRCTVDGVDCDLGACRSLVWCLSAEFEREMPGVVLCPRVLPATSSQRQVCLTEKKTMLAPIVEGPSSSRSSLM